MRPPRKAHPEFDPVALYEYPQHLREVMDHLPQAPGVYIFEGQEGDLPLYIGKSVNLRHRVLSHLRNEEEARMLRQAVRIDHVRTCGEIGALLLEAQLIKQRQPLFNQKLRRTKQLCAWQVPDDDGSMIPSLVFSKDVNFASTPRLYGLYSSRHAALQSLQSIADQHRLCYGLLKMEKLAPGKPCFRSMLKQCAGACCGKESREEHDARLLAALEDIQVNCWPFPGPIGLVERWEDQQQIHVIHQWCYLGSVETEEQAKGLNQQAAGFDADGYKILCKPILSGQHPVIALWSTESL